jgi:hypothetical protein
LEVSREAWRKVQVCTTGARNEWRFSKEGVDEAVELESSGPSWLEKVSV